LNGETGPARAPFERGLDAFARLSRVERMDQRVTDRARPTMGGVAAALWKASVDAVEGLAFEQTEHVPRRLTQKLGCLFVGRHHPAIGIEDQRRSVVARDLLIESEGAPGAIKVGVAGVAHRMRGRRIFERLSFSHGKFAI